MKRHSNWRQADSSYIFFDCKQVTQDPEGIYLIAELIFDEISNLAIDSIGGIQTGAIPIVLCRFGQSHEAASDPGLLGTAGKEIARNGKMD